MIFLAHHFRIASMTVPLDTSHADLLSTATSLAMPLGLVLFALGTVFECSCGMVAALALATGIYMTLMGLVCTCGIAGLQASVIDRAVATVCTVLFVGSFLLLDVILLFWAYTDAPQPCQGVRNTVLVAVAAFILAVYMTPAVFVALAYIVVEVYLLYHRCRYGQTATRKGPVTAVVGAKTSSISLV